MKTILSILLSFVMPVFLGAQTLSIKGKLSNSLHEPVPAVQVHVAGTGISALSNSNGEFSLVLIQRATVVLQFRHLSFQFSILTLHPKPADTLLSVEYTLQTKTVDLPEVAINTVFKPETLVGKPNYSIYDFDFCDHGILLLTAERNLKEAVLRFTDFEGNVLTSQKLPKYSGEAKYFYHDYQGFTDLICKDTAYRIEVFNDQILVHGIRKTDFETYIQSVSDTLQDHLLWTNRSEYFPMMDYYRFKKGDSITQLLKKISNADLMRLYRLEYYYLPAQAKLEARIIANNYNTDKHIVAAMMSGFTQSMYYEALYAPLFVIRDTICIFDHYSDHLFHYTKDGILLDSTRISYHHPERWRDWKRKLFVDPSYQKVWAYFSRDGRHFLKEIDAATGAITRTYTLQNHSAERMKIRDGYVYYVYRPFESTQQKFLYRERLN